MNHFILDENQIIKEIDNKLARCLNIYQAQDVLKDYLYILSVCSQNFECQTIKEMLSSFSPITVNDKNFITYCQNVKLEKNITGLFIDACAIDKIEKSIVYNAMTLDSTLSYLQYKWFSKQNLLIAYFCGEQENVYAYFANNKILPSRASKLIIFGVDNDGLLMDCPYNKDVLKTFISFKEE